jgi:hypothetical protein
MNVLITSCISLASNSYNLFGHPWSNWLLMNRVGLTISQYSWNINRAIYTDYEHNMSLLNIKVTLLSPVVNEKTEFEQPESF